MMKTVSGFVSLRELLFYLRSTLAINAASLRTEENFNDRNFNRERESYVFQSNMLARKVRTLKRKIEFRSFSKKQHEKQQRQHLVKKRMYQPDYLLET